MKNFKTSFFSKNWPKTRVFTQKNWKTKMKLAKNVKKFHKNSEVSLLPWSFFKKREKNRNWNYHPKSEIENWKYLPLSRFHGKMKPWFPKFLYFSSENNFAWSLFWPWFLQFHEMKPKKMKNCTLPKTA